MYFFKRAYYISTAAARQYQKTNLVWFIENPPHVRPEENFA